MQREIDPLKLLGMPFATVAGELSHAGIEHVFDETDDPTLAAELFVSATDGTWQFLLDEEGRIATIFLFADKGCKLPFGLTPGMTPSDVTNLLGAPTRHSGATVQKYLGPKGSWSRWDTATHCVHIEYGLDVPTISMVTLMMPKHAPSAA